MVAVTKAAYADLNLRCLRFSIPHDGVCHVQLDRPPVNALNTRLWSELLLTLNHVETQLFPETIRVMVISSNAHGAIFSAGNDLTELHVPSTTKSRFTKFWLASAMFLTRLYKSPLFTIAAIRGAAPAGGCAIALCCDYRLALNDASIGLNEVAIGLSVPTFWARLFVATTTRRSRGEELLAEGELVSAKEALKLGLVDQVVHIGGREELHKQALVKAEKWAYQKEVLGRADTKLSIRKEFADAWSDYALDESQKAWGQLCEPGTIAKLGCMMNRLSQRQKAKM